MAPPLSRMIRLVAALSGVVLLSGCFAGPEALIAGPDAALPFKDSAQFTEYVNCAAAGASLLGCAGYKEQGMGSIRLEHGAYVVRPDATDDQQMTLASPAPSGSQAILFRAMGDNLYLVQIDLGPEMAAGEGGPGARYLYEFMSFDGKTGYFYQPECETFGDAVHVRAGRLKATTSGPLGVTCTPSNFPGLVQVFRERLAGGLQPVKKFVVTN